MTANEKRKKVADTYKTILGRNYYSQARRNYCFKVYTDGKYYSDCSSSICYSYDKAGYGFGILNTVGMWQSKKLTEVPCGIQNGQVVDVSKLRVGDMLLFAGGDSGRAYANFVGHVEMVYKISGSTITICGHGGGHPSTKDMKAYCSRRYATRSTTKLGHKGLIKVVRFIQDDAAPKPETEVKGTVEIVNGNCYVRAEGNVSAEALGVARQGRSYPYLGTNSDGWNKIHFDGVDGWVSPKYSVKKA